ncbi:MAG: DUF1501 domain-containing protein [Dehalococcoidia bacterium]
MNRRNFLKESLALVAFGAAVPSVFGKAVIAAAEESNSLTSVGKTLVVVQLAGGYDGLNMVVPYRDGAYRSLRPTLGVPEAELLPLDDRFAFNPALSGLKGLYDGGKLAVVHGVGYPNPDFSHFKAMDIWQTGDLDGQGTSGWLGRYFDELTDPDGHPLAGMSVGRSLPTAFNSLKSTVPSVESVETFALQPANGDSSPESRKTSLLKLYDAYRPAGTSYAALLDTTMDSAYQSSLELAAAHAAYKPAAAYPQSGLASGLQMLAELIDSGKDASPLRVGHVTLGGFDTHTGEDTRLGPLLTQTSEALTAFQHDLEAHGHGDEVVTLVWSEFGRRPQENAQSGTDHGSALPIFVMGSNVKGGLHGEPPSLTNLDNGNLRFTTDFRSIYATLLEKWLQAPAKDILGESFPQLDLLKV